jgi:hypothetical protein
MCIYNGIGVTIEHGHMTELRCESNVDFIKLVSAGDKCIGLDVDSMLFNIDCNRRKVTDRERHITRDITKYGQYIFIAESNKILKIEHSGELIEHKYIPTFNPTSLTHNVALCVSTRCPYTLQLISFNDQFKKTYYLRKTCVEIFSYFFDPVIGKVHSAIASIRNGMLMLRSEKGILHKYLENHRYKQIRNVFVLNESKVLIQLISPYVRFKSLGSWTCIIDMDTMDAGNCSYIETILDVKFLANINSTLIFCKKMFFILRNDALQALGSCGFMKIMMDIDKGMYETSMYYAYSDCLPCFSLCESVVSYISHGSIWVATTTFPFHLHMCRRVPSDQTYKIIHLHHHTLILTTVQGKVFQIDINVT